MAETKYITIKEAAAKLQVSENTIRRMFDRGDLDGFKTPSGHRRIYRGDVLRLSRKSTRPHQGIIL